jgi:hypothetical protein
VTLARCGSRRAPPEAAATGGVLLTDLDDEYLSGVGQRAHDEVTQTEHATESSFSSSAASNRRLSSC